MLWRGGWFCLRLVRGRFPVVSCFFASLRCAGYGAVVTGRFTNLAARLPLALDRASMSDGLCSVPGPGGDTPPLTIFVGWGIEPCRGGAGYLCF